MNDGLNKAGWTQTPEASLTPRFMLAFTSLEHSVLAYPHLRMDDRYRVSWDKVTRELERRGLNGLPIEFHDLCFNGQQVINSDGNASHSEKAMEATLSTAIESMRVMRNNLMRSPKGNIKSAQNNQLLCIGLGLMVFIDSEKIVEKLSVVADPAQD
ncbi:hypothetical protein [Paenalcaligenes suwonensis]|uniref:hypothetical protein n=1 Tax=Paenalcaligenes suwonensis TaxID=1202713 RepID=UPI00140BE95A|nr:hypothetical protein [Paenalcaligenes suwonensis]NHC61663.1 hypothetical protein [Paenalcaligenes suwonensis]